MSCVRAQQSPLRNWARSIASVTPNPRAAGVFGFDDRMSPVQAAFTAVMSTGVFEPFPRLKYVMFEEWLDGSPIGRTGWTVSTRYAKAYLP